MSFDAIEAAGEVTPFAATPTAAGALTPHKISAVIDDTGKAVAIDSLPQALAYDGDGNLETITATDGSDSWVQTLTYTDGVLTAVSAWVKQS